jgi:chemotaxis protein MotB
MNRKSRTLCALTGALVTLPLLGGCATQAELQQREDEIAALREERTRLKKENHALELQLDEYERMLAAQEPVQVVPAAAPLPLYPELDARKVDYGMRGGDMVISVPAEVSFGSGRAELSKQGKDALSAVADVLLGEFAGNTLWIEGHTDTDPISKSKFESNRHLSIERAMAVHAYLVEKCGVPDDECVVVGHGQYSPVASNDSSSDKAKNRRVEIVVRGGA